MYDAATIAALERGDLILRDFLTVMGRIRSDTPVAATFAYWTGEANVSANVVPAGGTTPVSRNYIGGGMLRDVPQFVDAIGLEFHTSTFGLDHIQTFAGSPMDMLNGYDVRVARVELHRGLVSPDTWQLVANPHLVFAGRVDGALQEDAAAGGEGSLTLDVAGEAVDLTKTSPAMKSDEQQRLRDGDRYRRHSDPIAQIEVWWGMVKGDAGGGKKITDGKGPTSSRGGMKR